MSGETNLMAMGFTEQSFPAGTHMCLLYADDKERRKVIGKFLESGIMGKEKVIYFTDMMKPEEVREWLLNMGIELPKDDGFSILVAEDTYCSEGKFVPEKVLNTVRALYEQAQKAGYPNVRASIEMSWALKGIPGSDRLMEYEALLNEVLKTHPVTVICQYDVNQCSGPTIVDVLKVHPMSIVHGQIVQNSYYMKPQEFLRDYLAGL